MQPNSGTLRLWHVLSVLHDTMTSLFLQLRGPRPDSAVLGMGMVIKVPTSCLNRWVSVRDASSSGLARRKEACVCEGGCCVKRGMCATRMYDKAGRPHRHTISPLPVWCTLVMPKLPAIELMVSPGLMLYVLVVACSWRRASDPLYVPPSTSVESVLFLSSAWLYRASSSCIMSQA